METLPPFIYPLLHSLSSIQKKAEEYIDSQLSDNALFTKISYEIGEIENPIEELKKASMHFQKQFKIAAIQSGYSKEYIQGVFDTAEKLFKNAAGLGELGDAALPAIEQALPRMTQIERSFGKYLRPDPIVNPAKVVKQPTSVNPTYDRARARAQSNAASTDIDNTSYAPQNKEPGLQAPVGIDARNAAEEAYSNKGKSNPVNTSTPESTPQPSDPTLFNKLIGKAPLDNSLTDLLWNGTNREGNRGFIERNMAPASILGTGAMFGPIGTAAAAPAALLARYGARQLGTAGAIGAGALYGGKKLLDYSGITGGVEQGIKDNISGTNTNPADPISKQNDLIPGLDNGWTGTLAGGLGAMLLAKHYGLSGLPGLATTLLGAYGGDKYLPSLLSNIKNNEGNFGGMLNPGYGAGYPQSGTITPDSIAALSGEHSYP